MENDNNSLHLYRPLFIKFWVQHYHIAHTVSAFETLTNV